MTESELKDKMELEPHVKFVYRKLDGSNRVADGTRQTGDFSDEWDDSRQVVTYWDNEKGDYRCFKQDNLVMMIKEDPNRATIFQGVSLLRVRRRK